MNTPTVLFKVAASIIIIISHTVYDHHEHMSNAG